jgi:hypothetical protein
MPTGQLDGSGVVGRRRQSSGNATCIEADAFRTSHAYSLPVPDGGEVQRHRQHGRSGELRL